MHDYLHHWVPASKLKKGEHLQTPHGTLATADGGTTPKVHDGWMWDLTVPGNNDHDFYVLPVSELTAPAYSGIRGTAVLVHNCGDEQLPLFNEDPYRAVNDGKTRGILEIDGEQIPLTSREPSLKNYPASGHVEGQAALIMRERGATSATLSIDNPNGICGRCVSQVPTLLPEGAELQVQTPLGTVPRGPTWSNSRSFVGNAADPLPWPR